MLVDDVFVSKHLDGYFSDYDGDAKVSRTIELYEKTVDFIRSKNLAVQSILVFPLETLGSQISRTVPENFEDVVGMLDKLEPPLNPKCLGVQSLPFASIPTIVPHERFRDTRFGPGNHQACADSQRRNGQSISCSNRLR
jgi:hypothetical protein